MTNEISSEVTDLVRRLRDTWHTTNMDVDKAATKLEQQQHEINRLRAALVDIRCTPSATCDFPSVVYARVNAALIGTSDGKKD